MQRSAEIAQFLVEKHRILFDCAQIDDWNDPHELIRIVREIGTSCHLDALLIYTCAMLDYGKDEYYPKYHWDKAFSLYYTLKEALEELDPEKKETNGQKMMERTRSLSEEQRDILATAP